MIQQVADQQELRDEDEAAPPPAVVEQAKRLVSEAVVLMNAPMMAGVVSTFFGEINVTWRSGAEVVRLACFLDRPSILQYGDLSLPLGSYRSDVNPTAQMLADKLDEIAAIEA